MVEGNPVTRARLEAAGASVQTYAGTRDQSQRRRRTDVPDQAVGKGRQGQKSEGRSQVGGIQRRATCDRCGGSRGQRLRPALSGSQGRGGRRQAQPPTCSVRRACSTATRCTTAGPWSCAGQRIEAAGPASSITAPAGADTIDLPGATLMPGLIEAHSHVLLHAYNETSWNDQVLKEAGVAARGARGEPSEGHARIRLHDDSRPGHRGRRIRRRRTEAGGQSGHHPRAAHDCDDARDCRDRHVRAEGVLARCGRFRRAPRKPTATRSCGSCAIRPAAARTGSRCTATIAPGRTARRRRRSRRTK